jgi:hypothetical protein
MDKILKTTWIYSPDTEVERVVHATRVAASGFYSRKGFLLSNNLIEEYPELTVVIPNLGYNSIPHYWQRIEEVPLQLPMVVPEDLHRDVGTRLEQDCEIEKILNQRRDEWDKIGAKWWSEMSHLLPDESELINELEVRVSAFGTISSYSFLTKRKGQKLVIYIRADATTAHLVEAILTALLYPSSAELGLTWSKREAIVDFYLTRKQIMLLLPGYRPTLTNLSRVPQHIRKQSQEYEELLGWPKSGINQEKYIVQLPSKEAEVARVLWSKRGELVSFDELADLMWGEGEFGTFWAINKRVQRIRKDLKKIGGEEVRIKTLRGRGYLWEI